MKVAVIGSRGLEIEDFSQYLPSEVEEIVSGGACGIDSCASRYCKRHNIRLKEFLPEYEKYGRSAPLKRNIRIIEYVDLVLVFWDGKSRGTKFVIDNCNKMGILNKVFVSNAE